MPPRFPRKKKSYQTRLRKRRAEYRIRRLLETDEQRETRRSQQQNYYRKFRAKRRNLFMLTHKNSIEKLIEELDASDSASELLDTNVLSKSLQVSAGSMQGSTSDRNENLLYACLWDNCHHQFENQYALMCHLDIEPYGHIWQSYSTMISGKFECLWYNCERIKKNLRPFTCCLRLIRHVKACHLNMPSKDILAEHQKKCVLCPCTKVIGMEVRSMESTRSKLQDSLGLPQVASIKEKLILPDDKTNQSFNNLISLPTRVERKFNADRDQSTVKPGSVQTDAPTGIDVTHSNAAIPNVSAHTGVVSSIRQLHTKSRSRRKMPTSPDNDTSARQFKRHATSQMKILKTRVPNNRDLVPRKKTIPSGQLTTTSPDNDVTARHFKPHATPQRKKLKTRLPNNPNPLPREKTIPSGQLTTTSPDNDTSARHFKPHATSQMKILMMRLPNNPKIHCNSPQHKPIIVNLQKRPVEQPFQKVSANLQSQQSVNSQALVPIVRQSQVPIIDLPQVASIKEELILLDDGTIPSFINSSSEPTSVERFCIKQETTEELRIVPSDNTAMGVTENINITRKAHTPRTSLQWPSGQLPLSTAMDMNTPCDIAPTDVLPVDLNLIKKEQVDLNLVEESVDLNLVKKEQVDVNLVKKEVDDETLCY